MGERGELSRKSSATRGRDDASSKPLESIWSYPRRIDECTVDFEVVRRTTAASMAADHERDRRSARGQREKAQVTGISYDGGYAEYAVVEASDAARMLSGKSISGWPSGSSIDSEETMAFSALTNVRPRIEKFKLDQAEEAFSKTMENKVRFRAVLVP